MYLSINVSLSLSGYVCISFYLYLKLPCKWNGIDKKRREDFFQVPNNDLWRKKENGKGEYKD